jgi:putative nucleotidyltransferase with HDIG domain
MLKMKKPCVLKQLIFLSKIFKDVEVAVDGKDGLDKYLHNNYDLIITDILMPNINGLELISNIRKKNKKQEIIVTSAYTELSYLTESIKLGVTGYIIKPLDFNNVIDVIEQSLDKLLLLRENEMYKTKLEEMVDEKTKKVLQLQDELVVNYEHAIKSLVKMMESRDTYTGGHSERVAQYSKDIADAMGIEKEQCDLIYQAGILHDIGKIITPDSILLKPGKLTEDEYSLIKDHVTAGYEILSEVPMYKELADIVHAHHEHYDGSGYPRSLKGKKIPLLARIMTVADTFDAMTTSRVYKGRKSKVEAIQEMLTLSGSWYDPDIIKIATETLNKVDIIDDTKQEPHSIIDDERFAYFYKDPLTHGYNHLYLDFILRKHKDEKNFLCFNIIYVRNFTSYNKKHGWSEGDLFLSNFATYLQSEFPDSQLFRMFGDNFLLLKNIHQDVDIDKINKSELLKTNNLRCELKHFDLQDGNINSYMDLQEGIKLT